MTATVTNEYLRKEFDNFEKKGELGNLFEELQYSTLIVPMDDMEEGCAMLEMAGKIFIPLFTDIHEYQKVNLPGIFHPKNFEFNFYLEILEQDGIEGFVVNAESERFPITKEFLDFIDPIYIFDLDYQPFTAREIKNIYESISNTELEEFLKDESNRGDYDKMMELLLGSDILSVVVSKENLDRHQEKGVISIHDVGRQTYFRTRDNYAVIFSSREKIDIELKGHHLYSALVNLGLFIDFVLKSDLAGIILDGGIVISRDYLIGFMKGFTSPCIDKYDDYIFPI